MRIIMSTPHRARPSLPEGIDALGDHIYGEWIGKYAAQGYQVIAVNAPLHLDDLAARAMNERRFDELAKLLGQASRLEADSWQMGTRRAL